MMDEYILFTTGLLGLILGLFGLTASLAILIGVAVGLITLGTVGLVAMVIVFLISLLGAVTSYLWFIDAAE